MKQIVERFFPYAAILLVFLLLLSRLLFGFENSKASQETTDSSQAHQAYSECLKMKICHM
ncbi:MAG: hypothetical protein HY694_15525 [Deltaproteobacteria bacterium]|nr:hypothetical protein [Deltaproteobacteria bacterium]